MIPCYVDKIYTKSNLAIENHRVQDAYHLQMAEDPYHHRSFNWFAEPKPIFKWFQRSTCVKLCKSPIGITACCFLMVQPCQARVFLLFQVSKK